MDITSDEYKNLKNTDLVSVTCDGCGDMCSITFEKLKRLIKKDISIYCSDECRPSRFYIPIYVDRYDSYGRGRTPTAYDDDWQNRYYQD